LAENKAHRCKASRKIQNIAAKLKMPNITKGNWPQKLPAVKTIDYEALIKTKKVAQIIIYPSPGSLREDNDKEHQH